MLKKNNLKNPKFTFDVGEELVWRLYPKKGGGQSLIKVTTGPNKGNNVQAYTLIDDNLIYSNIANQVRKYFHKIFNDLTFEKKEQLVGFLKTKTTNVATKTLLDEAVESWRLNVPFIEEQEGPEPILPDPTPDPTPEEEGVTGEDLLKEIENKGRDKMEVVERANAPIAPETLPPAAPPLTDAPEELNVSKQFPGEDTTRTNSSYREKIRSLFTKGQKIPSKVKEDILDAPKTMVDFLTDPGFRNAQMNKAKIAISRMPERAFKGISSGLVNFSKALIESGKGEITNLGKLYRYPQKMASKWKEKRDELIAEGKDPDIWKQFKATIPKLRKTDPETGKKVWDDDGLDDIFLLLGTGGYIATAALTFGSNVVGGAVGKALLAAGTSVGKSFATHVVLNASGDWMGSKIKNMFGASSEIVKWVGKGGKKLKEYFVKKSPDTAFMGAEWTEWWGAVGAAAAKGDAGAAADENVIFETFKTSDFFDKTTDLLGDMFTSAVSFVDKFGDRLLTASVDDHEIPPDLNVFMKEIQASLVNRIDRGFSQEDMKLALSFDLDKYPGSHPTPTQKVANHVVVDPKRFVLDKFSF